MSAETVICGARAAACRCVLEPGHFGPHACNETCGGSWRGEFGTDSFEVIAFPSVEAARGRLGLQ